MVRRVEVLREDLDRDALYKKSDKLLKIGAHLNLILIGLEFRHLTRNFQTYITGLRNYLFYFYTN